MPNPNQRAGRAWEEDAARFLREHGHPAADTIRIRHPDRGDIGGVEDWTLECKAPGPGDAAARGEVAAKGAAAYRHRDPVEAFLAGFVVGSKHPPGRFDMAAALDQLGKARAAAGTPYGAVLRKRRGHGPGDGFAIMPVSMLVGIITRLAESESTL
jgi:hypothetical protein